MRKFALSLFASALFITTVCACGKPAFVDDPDVKEVANTYVAMLKAASDNVADADNCNKFVISFGEYVNNNVSDTLDDKVKAVVADDEKMRSALYLLGTSNANADDFAKITAACKDNEGYAALIAGFNQTYAPFNEAAAKFK